MNPAILRHTKAALANFLKAVLGLPLYSVYLVSGHVPPQHRFALSQGVILGWVLVITLALLCAIELPRELSTADERAIRVLAMGAFPFIGWLIHIKAERDGLARQ